jgi:CheY-like chemotaxis protein
MIDRQLVQMVRLVDDLLDVSRITSGKLAVRKQPVELAAIVQSAVDTARPLYDDRRQSLSLELPTQPVYLQADAMRLAQVFANLLNNAAKYSDPGSRVSLRAGVSGSSVRVEVEDHGIGISARMLDKLFEMFAQGEESPTRSPSGLGVGLALAKRLVELHGGSIEARSAGVGLGSELTVRLPLAPSSAPAESPPAARRPAARGAGGLRIVVADDNRDAASSLAALLALHGHRVELAHDGEHALKALERLRPQLALLDIGMPKVNGYDVARRVRAEPWGHATKLVAVTGWGQDHDRDRALAAGFDDHWVKPIEPDAALALCDEIAAAR